MLSSSAAFFPIRLGSRINKKSTAKRRPGRPTIRKVNCHGATSPTRGKDRFGYDFAQLITPALISDAMPAPNDNAAV